MRKAEKLKIGHRLFVRRASFFVPDHRLLTNDD